MKLLTVNVLDECNIFYVNPFADINSYSTCNSCRNCKIYVYYHFMVTCWAIERECVNGALATK